ncbi:MAG: hypothetical protein ABSB01_06380 [Streptosporangiaceae bacterium]
MTTIETVRGPVDVAGLGSTLMHGHVFILSTEHVQNYGDGLDDVLPALREAGVSDAQIEQMLVDNPRRYLSGGTS